MRTVRQRETLNLFKVINVKIIGSSAHFKGSLVEYNIHLVSAVVHKQASGYLSIMPVHAQQQGRLFWRFANDDPKSAELISKVLLLAKDGEIQDPTILASWGGGMHKVNFFKAYLVTCILQNLYARHSNNH